VKPISSGRSLILGQSPSLYEAYLGEVEGANLIKIHRRSGKLSYLAYPAFDTDPHPALARCVKLSLRTRQLECYDYAQSANPPILHRKETFLAADDPRHAKFTRLTAQEEKADQGRSPAAGKRRWGERVGAGQTGLSPPLCLLKAPASFWRCRDSRRVCPRR
jgi:hypothetical protein